MRHLTETLLVLLAPRNDRSPILAPCLALRAKLSAKLGSLFLLRCPSFCFAFLPVGHFLSLHLISNVRRKLSDVLHDSPAARDSGCPLALKDLVAEPKLISRLEHGFRGFRRVSVPRINRLNECHSVFVKVTRHFTPPATLLTPLTA